MRRGGALARNLDLVLTAAAAVALAPVALLLPDGHPARASLALLFVLLVPGYALTAALFPRRRDLGPLERLALAAGLSLATVPLLALALNYSPWGVRTSPLVAAAVALVLLGTGVSLLRRLALDEGEAFAMPSLASLAPGSSLARWGLTAALLLAVVAMAAGAYVTARQQTTGARFTEFYMLGPTGEAAYYPSEARAGEPLELLVGVGNYEGKSIVYRIEARLGGETLASLRTPELADGTRWQGTLILTLERPGVQRVELLLHREGTDGDAPYRRLQLTLDVSTATAPVAGR
ncbi:hypothetical protein HRbin25_00018 [bacterium HR25]|nr:hypothetical protein HRbin25_00018 [bacterium HR25]